MEKHCDVSIDRCEQVDRAVSPMHNPQSVYVIVTSLRGSCGRHQRVVEAAYLERAGSDVDWRLD